MIVTYVFIKIYSNQSIESKTNTLILTSMKGELYLSYLMNMYNLHDLYSNIFTQVIIEGFKPRDEPKLAVDDISFSKEQCEEITCKYNGGVTMMENETSSQHAFLV